MKTLVVAPAFAILISILVVMVVGGIMLRIAERPRLQVLSSGHYTCIQY